MAPEITPNERETRQGKLEILESLFSDVVTRQDIGQSAVVPERCYIAEQGSLLMSDCRYETNAA